MTDQNRQSSDTAAAAQQGARPQHRSDEHGESWVEVSSHPSSSSVSSIGDEIVTTGLHVGSPAYSTRRRRLHPHTYSQLRAQQQQEQRLRTHLPNPSAHNGTSSQEEYDESETDSDHVLTSSTENIASVHIPSPTPLRRAHAAVHDSSDEEDDDDHATALGTRRPSEPFRPQPNAFSHPPSHLQHRHSTNSSIPQHHPRPSFSQRSNTRVDRRTPNFMSPNHQADNDAALRASLTTLLSCAAAARGRTKESEEKMGERSSPSSGGQPMNLCLVPERELMDPGPRPVAQGRVLRSDPPTTSPPSSRETATGSEKVKRAATPTLPGKQPRATKKKRTSPASGAEETLVSPTLLTWVVSAGVVVLVSVVGFGAGYVIGREVGRQETLNSLGAGNTSIADGGSCGREVIRSGGGTLRRFRWGSVVGKGVTA